MKRLLIAIIFLFSLRALGQNNEEEFDGRKWDAPYTLKIPEGWDVERFLIPIGFAPSIPYKGVEDIRFTPGWGKAETNEYWSYAFLWYLDGTTEMDAETIESNLKAYYTGLFDVNTDKSKTMGMELVPVTTTIKKIKTQKGDLKTFKGTVNMNDYMTLKAITLNLVIHLKTCPGQNKSFVFYEVSPKPYTDNVWQSLNQLWVDFTCEKPSEPK